MPFFTPEDLVLYLYEESSPQQTDTIEKAMNEDWTLREKLSVIKSSIQQLDKIRVTPRTEVVLNILNYAREKTAEEVQS
jgi:hypothetical protein